MKMHLFHILVQYQYEAEDLIKKLQSGSSFEDLAQKFSKCSSSKKGGDLGLIPLNRLDSTFAEAAELLKPNEMSKPIRTKFGYHLIKRIS
jgi:parvulin-like peptidyl-prolyl isomerase